MGLYHLITGDYPFAAQWPPPRHRNAQWWMSETSRIIQDPRSPFKTHTRLNATSPQLRDLLHKILQKDHHNRPDPTECLQHPWFLRHDALPPPLSVGMLQNMKAYSEQPELKKAIFLYMAHQSTQPGLQELRSIFTYFDKTNKGALSSDTLRLVLQATGLNSLSVEGILYALDRDDSDAIHWTEFIAAVLCGRNEDPLALPQIRAAFSVFDRDCDGNVSADDILEALAPVNDPAAVEVWKKQIGQECARLSRRSPTGPYTKEHFEKFVSFRMRMSPGNSLFAGELM